MFKERVLKLRKKIDGFVASGGDVYASKGNLPYYEDLHTLARYIRKKTGKDITHDEIYMLCGYKIDRDYNDFIKFIKEVSKFADKDGCVDKIRDVDLNRKGGVYQQLKVRSRAIDASPFDYLVLMTGFRFKDAFIEADYVQLLKMELLKEYPKRDITGIRRNRPDLYEKIRAVARANPNLSMTEVVEFLGFYNSRLLEKDSKFINNEELIRDIKQCYPDLVVDGITKNPKLYRRVVWASRVEGLTPGEWLKNNGFIYTTSIKSRRMIKVKVDGEERCKFLLGLKQKVMEDVNLSGLDAIDLYHKHLEAAKKVIEILKTYDHQIVNSISEQNEQ